MLLVEPKGTTVRGAAGGEAPGGEEVLTVREVARYLRVTTKTVYALIKGNQLIAFRVGRHMRCRRSDVETFISTHRSQTQGGLS